MKTTTKQYRNKTVRLLRMYFLRFEWWESVLLVIGTTSIITIIITLFLPVGGASRDIRTSSSVPAATSRAFLETVSGSLSVPIGAGENVEILNNGDDFMPKLLADIDSAQSTINFMAYIWRDGSMSDQIFLHLRKKAEEGVAVRVLLDGFGGMHAPRDKIKELEKAGGKVEQYRALSIAPWNLNHNHKRNHRRGITIDGTIGYTGGMAVEDKWLGDARNPAQWRDMMFRLQGPMVTQLQGSFAELWASSTGEILAGPEFYPLFVTSLGQTMTYLPLSSSPSSDVFLLHKLIFLTMESAQQKLYITTPYFLPDRAILESLKEKARAGVDVRIIVPNDLTDTPSVRYASQYFYERLLEAGVKIYEYQPTFIHSKYIIADGNWTVIGSANMDNRSRKINEENVLGIFDKTFAVRMEQVFWEDRGNAQEITLAQWQRRGLWQRFREIFAQKFVKQF